MFDLTGERYRDRVAIPATNGSFLDWFTVFRDQHGTDTATQLASMTWWPTAPATYPNNRSIVEAAGRGEIDMGLVNHYYQYQEAAAAGDRHRAANHNFGDDDIGSLLIIAAATVMADSDNAEAANDLIAYLLSAGGPALPDRRDPRVSPRRSGSAPAAVLPPLNALGNRHRRLRRPRGRFHREHRDHRGERHPQRVMSPVTYVASGCGSRHPPTE